MLSIITFGNLENGIFSILKLNVFITSGFIGGNKYAKQVNFTN